MRSITIDFTGLNLRPIGDTEMATTIIIAGPPLTPSQLHCATVGAGWALAADRALNSAHWQAAKATQWGYRAPDFDLGDILRCEPPQDDLPLAA
jgi:hypothetical protein